MGLRNMQQLRKSVQTGAGTPATFNQHAIALTFVYDAKDIKSEENHGRYRIMQRQLQDGGNAARAQAMQRLRACADNSTANHEICSPVTPKESISSTPNSVQQSPHHGYYKDTS